MATTEQTQRAMEVGNERTRAVLSTIDACLEELAHAKYYFPVFESREELESMRSRIHRRLEAYESSRRSKTIGKSFHRPPRKSRKRR